MTQGLNTLAQKQFNKRSEKQEALGYPNFKNGIARDLTANFNVSSKEALQLAYLSDVNKMISRDIAWSQHMGTEYWAEIIYRKFFFEKKIG